MSVGTKMQNLKNDNRPDTLFLLSKNTQWNKFCLDLHKSSKVGSTACFWCDDSRSTTSRTHPSSPPTCAVHKCVHTNQLVTLLLPLFLSHAHAHLVTQSYKITIPAAGVVPREQMRAHPSSFASWRR